MTDTERTESLTPGHVGPAETDRQFGSIFWVTVAISLAFVLCGVLVTDPFNDAFSRFGRIKLGGPTRSQSSAVPLVRDAVPGRDGDRSAVLGRGAAVAALPDAADGPRGGGHARGGRARAAVHAPSLDAAPVGDLRRGRTGRRLLQLRARHEKPAHQLGVPALARRPRRRAVSLGLGPSRSTLGWVRSSAFLPASRCRW
jgi:hypothetical protein